MKTLRVKYMTESCRVMPSCQVCEYFVRRVIQRSTLESFYLEKIVKLLYQILYPHNKYPHYSRIIRSAFREKTLANTLKVRDCYTHNHLYISLWFSSTSTSPSLDLWEVVSPNAYHTILSVKWDFGAARKHWKEPFIGGCNQAKLWDPKS